MFTFRNIWVCSFGVCDKATTGFLKYACIGSCYLLMLYGGWLLKLEKPSSREKRETENEEKREVSQPPVQLGYKSSLLVH